MEKAAETAPAINQEQNLDAVTENMSTVNPDVTDMPEATPPAPETPSTAAKPSKDNLKAATDRQGRKFDPALHEVDEHGKPRLNRDGYLAGKPGRPGKFKQAHRERVSRVAPADPQQPPAQPGPDRAEIDRRNTARISAVLFIRFGIGFFGDEWLPIKREGMDEQTEMVDLFDNYYRSKGISDLPPGWALALGLAGYAAVRIHLPKTQSKMKILFITVQSAVGNFFRSVFGFFKKFKGVKVNASHVNTRDHGERENNAGAPTGEAIPPQGNPGPSA